MLLSDWMCTICGCINFARRTSCFQAIIWLYLKGMADRIIRMRTSLRENIEKLGSPLSWEHITNQIGMFFYSGMTPEQVDCLTKEFHIYIVVAGHAYCSNCCSWPCLSFC
ncbi:putative aminotransferase, class I/classII [Helianthus annuus]|nr:putative aminotransferase, class I/classII [Helianthus annuus]